MSNGDQDYRKGIPAFPGIRIKQEGDSAYHSPTKYYSQGMSLRDYFAAKALNGMLSHSRNGHGYRPRDKEQNWHDAISEESYEIADAMLKAREE